MALLCCSGERTSAKDWPGILEIKGRVRLDAFEKFLHELPLSRSRAVMVSLVYFCCTNASDQFRPLKSTPRDKTRTKIIGDESAKRRKIFVLGNIGSLLWRRMFWAIITIHILKLKKIQIHYFFAPISMGSQVRAQAYGLLDNLAWKIWETLRYL